MLQMGWSKLRSRSVNPDPCFLLPPELHAQHLLSIPGRSQPARHWSLNTALFKLKEIYNPQVAIRAEKPELLHQQEHLRPEFRNSIYIKPIN